MRLPRATRLAAAVGLCVLGAAGTAGAATPAAHYGNVTCHGGTIRAGTYRSLRIVGVCTLTSRGTVTVKGGVEVEEHATLNTLTPGTFNVGGNVIVEDDAVAGLGCNNEVGCPTESNDHIGGSLIGTGRSRSWWNRST